MTKTTLDVIALTTLQFATGGMFDAESVDGFRVHLVRTTSRGTPGPTLCGIDRFHPKSAGWSVGGGVSGPDIQHEPCDGCVDVATDDFPGLPIRGSVGGAQMAAELERELVR